MKRFCLASFAFLCLVLMRLCICCSLLIITVFILYERLVSCFSLDDTLARLLQRMWSTRMNRSNEYTEEFYYTDFHDSPSACWRGAQQPSVREAGCLRSRSLAQKAWGMPESHLSSVPVRRPKEMGSDVSKRWQCQLQWDKCTQPVRGTMHRQAALLFSQTLAY